MEKKRINFETKCRRCGEIKNNSWNYHVSFERIELLETLEKRITSPTHEYCDNCEKPVIQDIVCYSSDD